MKRTMIALSAVALGGLCAAAYAGGAKEASVDWPTLLGLGTNLADTVPGNTRYATVDQHRTLASAGGCGGIWDNNEANGVNGYSNGTDAVVRSLLDDFEIPPNQTWTLQAFRHQHVWDTAAVGSGTGFELKIWSDAQGAPGAEILIANVTSYNESPGQGMFFDRPEALGFTQFDDIVLDAGRYWIEGAVAGPDNNFWLTSDQRESECWVNYSDFNGLESGTAQFGGPSGINWCLEGNDGGASQALRVFGLWQTALGGAILQDTGGTLLVSNIGSSGKDGVSSNIGDSGGGWSYRGTGPIESSITVTNLGTVDGTPLTVLGAFTMSETGGETSLSGDLTGLGATIYTRNLYLGEDLVQTSNIPQNVSIPLTMDQVDTFTQTAKRLGSDNIVVDIELDAPVTTSAGMADRVELIPQGSVANLEGLTDFNVEIAFLTADGGVYVLQSESLVMFGNPHTAGGAARMTTDGGVLRVSNLGSSGKDGVTIDLGNTLDSAVDIDGIASYASGSNQFLMNGVGCVDDAAGTAIGSANIVSNGGFTVIQGDFASISAGNTVRVTVFDDGVEVDSYTRAGGGTFVGALASASPPDPLPALIGVGNTDAGTPGFVLKFADNLNVQMNIGQTFAEGDEIRITSDDPDATVNSYSDLTLATQGIARISITAEAGADGPACGGGGQKCVPNPDLDGDGCVAFNDINQILGAWGDEGEPGIPGDTNCDGSVDFADINEILGAWGDGCDP